MLFLQILVLFLLHQTCASNSRTILELNDRNFYKQTTIHDNILIMFYTYGCEHCKRVDPEFIIASESINPYIPKIILAKMNCSEAGKETCNKTAINSFPDLKLYHEGEYLKNYKGPRTAWHIVKFMWAQINPPSQELKSIQEFKQFLVKQEDAVMVGFFEGPSKLQRAFHKLAKELRETMIFAHTYCGSLQRKQGVFDGIVLFRPIRFLNFYEEDRVFYSGRPVVGEMKIFISTHYHGLVGHRTPFNSADFDNPLFVLYYSVDYDKVLKEYHYWRHRVFKVANSFRNRASFAVSSKDDFVEELEHFGLTEEMKTKPVVVAITLNGTKYIMQEVFSRAALERFVRNVLDSSITPFIKSMPIPKYNDGAVIVAVANNFDKVVLKNGKDTLIQFYAPWCAHSQKFAPVFKTVGEKLINEDVAVVKMDATANDLPSYIPVSSYPTVFWMPKFEKKNLILYTGKKEVAELMKFVCQKATNELKGCDRWGNPKMSTQVKTEL